MALREIRPFRERGHYVEVHNALFDHIMPQIKPTSFKVLCYILRMTKGWGNGSEALSFDLLMEGTGIKSSATIDAAVKELLTGEYIVKIKKPRGNGQYESNTYSLNLDFKISVNPTLKNEVAPTSKNEDGEENPTSNFKAVPTLKNEVAPTSKNEEYYKSSTNQQNKYDDVPKNHFPNDPIKNFPEIANAVFEVLGSRIKIRYEMGTISAVKKAEIQKIVGMLVEEKRTLGEIQLFKENWPKHLDKPNPDPPIPRQMLDDFDRVVNWKPRGKVSMTEKEQLKRMAEIRQQQSQGGIS